MNTFTIPNITRALFRAMLQNLQAEGSLVAADVDSAAPLYRARIRGSGITATADHTTTSNTVTVTVIEKPLLLPMALIENRVRQAVERARGMRV